MKYEILNGENVINTIVATPEFMAAQYPDGNYRVVVEPPVPEPAIRTLTKLQFRNRFTFPEKQAIYAAAEASVDIRIFLDDVNAAEEINLDDPATIGGVQALEAGGLIAAGRSVEILG